MSRSVYEFDVNQTGNDDPTDGLPENMQFSAVPGVRREFQAKLRRKQDDETSRTFTAILSDPDGLEVQNFLHAQQIAGKVPATFRFAANIGAVALGPPRVRIDGNDFPVQNPAGSNLRSGANDSGAFKYVLKDGVAQILSDPTPGNTLTQRRLFSVTATSATLALLPSHIGNLVGWKPVGSTTADATLDLAGLEAYWPEGESIRLVTTHTGNLNVRYPNSWVLNGASFGFVAFVSSDATTVTRRALSAFQNSYNQSVGIPSPSARAYLLSRIAPNTFAFTGQGE